MKWSDWWIEGNSWDALIERKQYDIFYLSDKELHLFSYDCKSVNILIF